MAVPRKAGSVCRGGDGQVRNLISENHSRPAVAAAYADERNPSDGGGGVVLSTRFIISWSEGQSSVEHVWVAVQCLVVQRTCLGLLGRNLAQASADSSWRTQKSRIEGPFSQQILQETHTLPQETLQQNLRISQEHNKITEKTKPQEKRKDFGKRSRLPPEQKCGFLLCQLAKNSTMSPAEPPPVLESSTNKTCAFLCVLSFRLFSFLRN